MDPAAARRELRTGSVWATLRAEFERRGSAALRVVDAGGGTGGLAVPLARLGHEVTVVDPSPDSLAALERRAHEAGVAGRVRGVQGDLDELGTAVPPAAFDVALCHSVLEHVDDPAAALTALAGALHPGGTASVVMANRNAVVLARALAGHPREALHALADPDGRTGPSDPLLRRTTSERLVELVTRAGLRVVELHGARVVSDLVPGALLDGDPAATTALLELETALAGRPAFRDVAGALHVLARREPASGG